MLLEVLLAYRTSKRSNTGTTPFALTYGHDAVLPTEMAVISLRLVKQNDIDLDEYNQSMLRDVEDLDDERFLALEHLKIQEIRVGELIIKR